MVEKFDRFIEKVKAGKIEGLSCVYSALLLGSIRLSGCYGGVTDPSHIDLLCAHLRRWMSGKEYGYSLKDHDLTIYYDNECGGDLQSFMQGSELDWHIDAVLWVFEQEEKE